jgi:hypothetical protein
MRHGRQGNVPAGSAAEANYFSGALRRLSRDYTEQWRLGRCLRARLSLGRGRCTNVIVPTAVSLAFLFGGPETAVGFFVFRWRVPLPVLRPQRYLSGNELVLSAVGNLSGIGSVTLPVAERAGIMWCEYHTVSQGSPHLIA